MEENILDYKDGKYILEDLASNSVRELTVQEVLNFLDKPNSLHLRERYYGPAILESLIDVLPSGDVIQILCVGQLLLDLLAQRPITAFLVIDEGLRSGDCPWPNGQTVVAQTEEEARAKFQPQGYQSFEKTELIW